MQADDPAQDAAEPAAATPLRVSVAFQLDPLWRYGRPGVPWPGDDLAEIAEGLAHYFVTNLEGFGDPRGADLFVTLTVQRGDEKAGREYRSGHYVKAGQPGPAPDSLGALMADWAALGVLVDEWAP